MTTCVALRLVDSLALFLVSGGADWFIMHSAVLLGHRSTVLTVDDGADLHERNLIWKRPPKVQTTDLEKATQIIMIEIQFNRLLLTVAVIK